MCLRASSARRRQRWKVQWKPGLAGSNPNFPTTWTLVVSRSSCGVRAMISPQEGRSLFQQSLGCLTPARAARKLGVGPDVESLLECPICMTVVVKPVVTPCGHLFCEGCIAKYVHETHRGGALSGAQCPQCRQPIALGKLIDVSFVSKLVECLAVASPASSGNSISRREAQAPRACSQRARTTASRASATQSRTACSDSRHALGDLARGDRARRDALVPPVRRSQRGRHRAQRVVRAASAPDRRRAAPAPAPSAGAGAGAGGCGGRSGGRGRLGVQALLESTDLGASLTTALARVRRARGTRASRPLGCRRAARAGPLPRRRLAGSSARRCSSSLAAAARRRARRRRRREPPDYMHNGAVRFVVEYEGATDYPAAPSAGACAARLRARPTRPRPRVSPTRRRHSSRRARPSTSIRPRRPRRARPAAASPATAANGTDPAPPASRVAASSTARSRA